MIFGKIFYPPNISLKIGLSICISNLIQNTHTQNMASQHHIICYHCGDSCTDSIHSSDNKVFCCEGCKTVYELLAENDMCTYYDFEAHPGITLATKSFGERFAFLDDEKVIERLVDYADSKKIRVSFYIPAIHCTSCIWLLENLYRLAPGVERSEVAFLKKSASFTFQPDMISLRGLVELLATLGYEPEIRLSGAEPIHQTRRTFVYKLGVAGFCFGNIMLFSFPEYFHLDEIIDPGFKPFFAYLNLLLSLPVFFYSASGYFSSAIIGLKQKLINIDVPLSLGILAMFLRSSYEIISGTGAGFMDALAGLVFFLLIGKWFQHKSYKALSFERDYKSYFPLSITRIADGKESTCTIDQLRAGDTIRIRNHELIPADGLLTQGPASIDYSFVTGESEPVVLNPGEKVYAGGRQTSGMITVTLTRTVSQSYLTSLWNHDVFEKKQQPYLSKRTLLVSKYFTLAVLLIASGSALFWLWADTSLALNAFTSVLIITCPCALALTIPFSFGNTIRIFGRNDFYMKNADLIEEMAKVNTLVFDKTGTITMPDAANIVYEGITLNDDYRQQIYSITATSTHPLSIRIHHYLQRDNIHLIPGLHVEEIPGKGLSSGSMRIGSRSFVIGTKQHFDNDFATTEVFVADGEMILGKFIFTNQYRVGLSDIAKKLGATYSLHVLSGDNDRERNNLLSILGKDTSLHFRQQPEMKMTYISSLQEKNHHVMMLGDGLNDAGALKKADVGVAVTNKNATFFPACDGMLRGHSFHLLPTILQQAKDSMKVVRLSFMISFFYNIIGLSFAIRGELEPVVAAILMPVSSVSVIGFTVLATTLMSKKNGLK